MTQYIAPTGVVEVGQWEIRAPVQFRVTSSRLRPFDTAEVELDNTDAEAPAVAVGDSLQIHHGYREHGVWHVFAGVVEDVSRRNVLRLVARDEVMTKLAATSVQRTFRQSTALDVIEWAANAAGVELYPEARAALAGLPRRPRYVVTARTALQAIQAALRDWNLSHDIWGDPTGQLYVGPPESSPRAAEAPEVVLERGESLLRLEPSEADAHLGEAETIALPFLQHSQLIAIIDRSVWQRAAVARIEEVVHEQWPHARTRVKWRVIS